MLKAAPAKLGGWLCRTPPLGSGLRRNDGLGGSPRGVLRLYFQSDEGVEGKDVLLLLNSSLLAGDLGPG